MICKEVVSEYNNLTKPDIGQTAGCTPPAGSRTT